MEAIFQWSPYITENELLDQLHRIKHQGTVVIVYNLWEDEQGETELDFDADPHDIQLRGTNRDEKNISMATKYPNCKHFFTYRYSLRSYVSILYLRLPVGFKINLRGKEVRHHNLVHDLMLTQKLTYRPQNRAEHIQKDYTQMMAVVTIGFLKDAREHIDVQGFNVYHKNRLIKPFWRLWNLPGVQGRGIVGVLEANFVEPAHDKQDFERTIILARLETRLLEIQKSYWSKNCQEVGYVNNSLKKTVKSASKLGSAGDDRAMEKSGQAIMEGQTPPTRLVETRALTPLSSAAQRHFQAGVSKTHDGLIKPLSDIPPHSIPLAPKVPVGSQNSAQARSPTVSMGTGTAHEAEPAMSMPLDRQEPLQNCPPPMPLPVMRSLRSPMHRIPATAYRNHAVYGQAHAALKPNAVMSPPRQTSVDEGPVVFPGISGTSRYQAHSTPTLPEMPTTVVSRVDSENSLKETQSLLDACAPAVTGFLVSQPGQDRTEAVLSMQKKPLPQSEALVSPLGVCATNISPANLIATIPTRTELQQKKAMMQTMTLVDLNQGSAITTLRTEATEGIVARSSLADHGAELNTFLQTSPNKANASISTPRTPEVEHCGILNEIESSAELNAKIVDLKQKVKSLQQNLDQVTKERDSLKAELEDERRRKYFEDEELQKKLQALILRARELKYEDEQEQISQQ